MYIYYIDTMSLLYLFDYFQYNFCIKNFLKIVKYNIKKLYIYINIIYNISFLRRFFASSKNEIKIQKFDEYSRLKIIKIPIVLIVFYLATNVN